MYFLNQLFASFEKFNPSISQHIVSIEKEDFNFVIRISNSQIIGTSTNNVVKFFGNVPCKLKQVQNSHDVEVSISRVELPTEAYSITKVIQFIEAYKEKGLFLGVTNFGEFFLDLKHFTHAYISGSSGYGKSAFFRNILAQTLAFQSNIANFIVDPKKIDYKFAQNHPNVLGVYTETKEWASMFKTVMTELKFRMDLYKTAFTNPPNSINEYNELAKQHQEIPKLKRIFIWIDEAHELMNGPKCGEFNANMDYISRTGRAFGIHLILCSQSTSDINARVRAQCSNSFHFYQPESNSYLDYSFSNMLAIPGRLYYRDRVLDEKHEIQTPLCKADHAIAISNYWKSFDNKASAIYPLKIPQKVIESAEYCSSLRSGGGLRRFRLDSDKFNRSEDFWKDYLFDFYSLTIEKSGDDKTVKEKPMKKTKGPAKRSSKELLNEFEKMLSGDGDETSENQKEGSKLVATPSEQISLPSFSELDNSIPLVKLLKDFKKEIKGSPLHLKWLQVDRSKNAGLIATNKDKEHFRKDEIQDLVSGLDSLALDSIGKVRLDNYCKDAQLAMDTKEKAPLLIVEGPAGSGKRTIIKNIAFDLDIDVSSADDIDLYSLLSLDEDSFLKKDNSTKVNRSEKLEGFKLLLFEDPMQAIDFHRKAPSQYLVACHYTEAPSFFGFPELDFRYLDSAYCHVMVDDSMYMKEKVGAKLLKNILNSLDYEGEDQAIDQFVKRGVNCLPSSLYKLLKRAQNVSYLKNKLFMEDSIGKVLDEFQLNKTTESEFVKKMVPKKSKENLILNIENKEDVEEIIDRIHMLEDPKMDFEKNLRKQDRMVALLGGPPGTGKTLSAEVIAKETNKELWICDLGSLQSKYVGETEKFLSRLFQQAESAKVVLLLDECDSLISSRGSTESDHLKNWTNQFLRLLDSYSGILILTTNFMGRLDSAISRRIDLKSEFQMPEDFQMQQIIESMLFPDAPVCPELDLEKAVEGLRLSGGLIRNALERANYQFKKNKLEYFTTSLIRNALLEVQKEEEFINPTHRKIGIA